MRRGGEARGDLNLDIKEMYILRSLLVAGDEYGYQLAKNVEHLSDGKIRLGPGTLYPVLKRLLQMGLIERAGEARNEAEQVRKLYRITGPGINVLEENIRLLQKAFPVALQGSPA